VDRGGHGSLIVAGAASGQEGWVVAGVEQWAEIRRMHFVSGLSIKEIARRTGRDRNAVRRALRAQEPPGVDPVAFVG
jgi:hypothetical protein